jgi:starch synthase
MKILMITSEAIPYAKTGGLADAVSALSLNLAKNGHQVKIFMPLYSNTTTKLSAYNETDCFEVQSGNEVYECNAIETEYTEGLKFVFLKNEQLFGRSGVYGLNNTPYGDNDIRFSVLSKGALKYCSSTEWQPDIIHSHDWPAATAPAYLKYEKNDFFANTGNCFSIHNLGYQGIFSRHSIHRTNLPVEAFTRNRRTNKGSINFMKAALLNTDKILTVSEGYAKEILTPEFSFKMEKILKDRSNNLHGIINGIDYSEWNPEKDQFLNFNYSAEDLSGKYKHKKEFCIENGLNPDKPLITLISRLSDQKGIHQLYGNENIMEVLLSTTDANIVVVGTGEVWAEKQLKELESNYPNLKVFLEFNDRLAHRVEAAGDFFLMPSNYEPCGLNQMYSLRYGNIPIVHKTGGLADTVIDRNSDPQKFSGFTFDSVDCEKIIFAVSEALNIWYNDKKLLKKYITNGMNEDLSWKNSCKKYEKLYKEIIQNL